MVQQLCSCIVSVYYFNTKNYCSSMSVSDVVLLKFCINNDVGVALLRCCSVAVSANDEIRANKFFFDFLVYFLLLLICILVLLHCWGVGVL